MKARKNLRLLVLVELMKARKNLRLLVVPQLGKAEILAVWGTHATRFQL